MRYPKAKWVGADRHDYSPTIITHKFVVIHVAQGEFQSGIDAWFHNPSAQVSAHFSISKLGVVHQYVDTDMTAFDCAEWNGKSIGIEHLGYSGQRLTVFQRRSLRKLLDWIGDTHGVRMAYTKNPNLAAGGVIAHASIPEGWLSHPNCPGAPIIRDVIEILVDRILKKPPHGIPPSTGYMRPGSLP